MQIFLPYTNIIQVANCLDKRRLHKQIVECLQIIKAIAGISKAWQNYPICKMYKNNIDFLNLYYRILNDYWNIQKEFEKRNEKEKFEEIINKIINNDLTINYVEENINKYKQFIEVNKKYYGFNKIDYLYKDNIDIKPLIPNFINEEYLNTMKGNLYLKDKEFYKFFQEFEKYGGKNMYFVDNEWKYYIKGKCLTNKID